MEPANKVPMSPDEIPKPSFDPVVIELQCPVEMAKDEVITTLTLKPSARHFRDVSIVSNPDQSFVFEPYKLALVGAKMAGQTAVLVDKLHPADMMEVSTAVLGFIGSGRGTGPASSR